jgi:polyphosphate kinase
MHRNLDARVEAIVPIRDKSLRHDLCEILDLYLSDNQQSWELDSSGTYQKIEQKEGELAISCQQTLMERAKPN